MLINIEKQDDGSVMVFLSCTVAAPAAQLWGYLSEDDGLAEWFTELAVGELGEGGHMLLNMLPEALIKMPTIKNGVMTIFISSTAQKPVASAVCFLTTLISGALLRALRSSKLWHKALSMPTCPSLIAANTWPTASENASSSCTAVAAMWNSIWSGIEARCLGFKAVAAPNPF